MLSDIYNSQIYRATKFCWLSPNDSLQTKATTFWSPLKFKTLT